jgi:putative hydrolase of the HAD superfamily
MVDDGFWSRPGSSGDQARDQNLSATVDAVFLDAGGVLVTPNPDLVRARLASARPGSDPSSLLGAPSDAALIEAHYRAMAAVDLARSAPETFDAYHPAYLASLGIDAETIDHRSYDAVLDAAQDLWSTPYLLWTRPLPGVPGALAALAAAGVPLVIVSNADGRVADALADVVHVGPRTSAGTAAGDGPGTEVVAIVDSGAVGVAKPDPAIFDLAFEALREAGHGDLDRSRVIHVGDAYGYDVEGARAAGVTPVFVDPLGLHPDPGCAVADGLVPVAQRVVQRPGARPEPTDDGGSASG